MVDVMGVINVTPDSFSDGGQWLRAEAAIEHAGRLIEQGANIVDVGGESTRPGSDPVAAALETQRIVPVVEGIVERWPSTRVSVDTNKGSVAVAAINAGASLINDVSASLEDVAAAHGVGWIAMHSGGPSKTMQDNPQYDDVVEEVAVYLADAVQRGQAAGVRDIWIDPGIGFGKTFEHNLEIVANLDRFVEIGPVVLGVSRKRTIGDLHARSDGVLDVSASDRLEGSLAMATWGAFLGADMVRVHDVQATVHAVGVLSR